MALRREPIGPVPEETARVARAAFPRGSVCLQLRDVLGAVYRDDAFAPLFAARGRSAEAPWRLALVTVLQFAEGLSDRQAAEAVRARIDWKYARGLELTDSGFDFSVLCEFRRAWLQEYLVEGNRLRLRAPTEMPPAPALLESPHEPEARYGTERRMSWVGYKAHLTETCDDDGPHLVTHVFTTVAPAADVEQLAATHTALGRVGLLPGQHLVDAGYVRGRNLVAARDEHRIDLVGPIDDDRQWQARVPGAFGVTRFRVDWDARQAVCPRGRTSVRWGEMRLRGRRTVHVDFAPGDCRPCPARERCTRAAAGARSLTLQPRAEHEAIQAARQRQMTAAFAALYAHRTGVEGTLSQAVRAFGLRRARYRGLQKTHLQHVAPAAAVNLARLADGLNGVEPEAARRSRFAALASTAGPITRTPGAFANRVNLGRQPKGRRSAPAARSPPVRKAA